VKRDAEIAVIEMGANHQKEIESYCVYAEPTHGIVTNCGKAHLEGFGSLEGVCKGKGELFDYLRSHNGAAFAFDDYDYLHKMVNGIAEVTWYGTKRGLITGSPGGGGTFLSLNIAGTSFKSLQTNMVGDYNLPNVLCAVAVGKYFKVPDDQIKAAIENYVPSNSRSQMIKIGSNRIIMDAYNANPTSMKAAIENFAKIHSDNKVLLLGGMMELGSESLREHQDIIRLVEHYQWKNVVLVGGDFKNTNHHFIYFDSSEQAKEWLKQEHFEDAYFLIKGSRSIQMEKVLGD
jgi:UDP-N-acetylmuramoyl-tripeptide--D-alanyl-D-alanine ligase